MTTPPGGPYGQDPYGSNPYGQQPYWGGQPQDQPPTQPQSVPHPYPPPGAYDPSAYPPPGPYGSGPGHDPRQPPPGYQQQYPQPGQEAPGAWPAGPYPAGPPPNRNSKLPWLILPAVALVGIIALVVIMVTILNRGTDSAGPSPTTTMGPVGPGSGEQTATGCTPNVSGGDQPDGDMLSAGKLSFPISKAPGWMPYPDDQNPNLIDAVGLAQAVPDASQWMMQVEVAITNFVPGMDVAAQASKLMDCVANGPGYNMASPTLGTKETSSTTVDGVEAARVDAEITIGDTSKGVEGDAVTIIAVDTEPVTIFLASTPIGDRASAEIVEDVIAALQVSK
ncbi:hypothetical protein [Mycobacterium sp.]|uniref:hypothetical protein n=1 Tax=Mycobacterium sp. TaxID=1785 RepID=UPI003A8876FC